MSKKLKQGIISMSSYEVYLINLDRSKDRLAKMHGLLKQFDIDYQRVTAVDAQTLTEEIYQTVTTPNFEYPHQLKPGEIACFLSHRSCWQKLVDSDNDWALIFEDHCEFSPLAGQYLKSIDWIPQECELVQLIYSKNPVYTSQQISLRDGNVLATFSCSSPIGCSAYFISRKAAQEALANTQNISCPVDNFLFGPWSSYSKKIQAWRLLGAVVKRNETTKTTISGRGAENKTKNKERFHPCRLINKLKMKIHRIFMKKNYQSWWTTPSD